jgi:hypothetical protein
LTQGLCDRRKPICKQPMPMKAVARVAGRVLRPLTRDAAESSYARHGRASLPRAFVAATGLPVWETSTIGMKDNYEGHVSKIASYRLVVCSEPGLDHVEWQRDGAGNCDDNCTGNGVSGERSTWHRHPAGELARVYDSDEPGRSRGTDECGHRSGWLCQPETGSESRSNTRGALLHGRLSFERRKHEHRISTVQHRRIIRNTQQLCLSICRWTLTETNRGETFGWSPADADDE